MPLIRQEVQPGTTHRLRIEVETTPAQTGRAGAFALQEAVLTVGSGSPVDMTGLATNPWTTPAMPERAYPQPTSPASATVTGTPVFASGAGPGGEDVYDIPVASSAGWSVNDFTRAADQPEGEGQVYKVLQVPDGTTLRVHCKSGGMDIVSGDTLEEVIPLGVYVGFFDLVIDDYLNAGNTQAQLVLSMMLVNDGGNDPEFDSESVVTWTFSLTLDVDRAYRAG